MTKGLPTWSLTPDRLLLLAKLGTELFLGLAVKPDSRGNAEILTGAVALDPASSAPAWLIALDEVSAPRNAYSTQRRGPRGRYASRSYTNDYTDDHCADFAEAVRRWLDTAVAHPDLRQGIITAFTATAAHVPIRRLEIVELVRSWAGLDPRRRRVKQAVLARLLLPEWQRLLLILWIWFETRVNPGP